MEKTKQGNENLGQRGRHKRQISTDDVNEGDEKGVYKRETAQKQ